MQVSGTKRIEGWGLLVPCALLCAHARTCALRRVGSASGTRYGNRSNGTDVVSDARCYECAECCVGCSRLATGLPSRASQHCTTMNFSQTIDADILDRLSADPGSKTLGQLVQDRSDAANEIRRLRERLRKLSSCPVGGVPSAQLTAVRGAAEPAPRTEVLLKLADICKLLSVGRSTVYEWTSQERFPQPVRIGDRSVRWKSEEVQEWRRTLARSAARS